MSDTDYIERQISALPTWKPTGEGRRGEVILPHRILDLDRKLEVPARVSLVGASRFLRGSTNIGPGLHGGHGLRAVGDDWGPESFLVFNPPSDGRDHNGNFWSWLENISTNTARKCQGVLWGGAQMSGIRNMEIAYALGWGLLIPAGTRSYTIDGLRISDCEKGARLIGVQGATMTNVAFDRIEGICLDVDRSPGLVGTQVYSENNDEVLSIGPHTTGCDIQLMIHRTGGGAAKPFIDLHSSHPKPGNRVHGIIRQSPDPHVRMPNGDVVPLQADGDTSSGTWRHFEIQT